MKYFTDGTMEVCKMKKLIVDGEISKMKDMTSIVILLDRSGSMKSIAREVVGMYNRFLDEQKQGKDYAELSLIQFDDQYEENYLRKPINKCEHLILGSTYEPRGMTALLDSVGKSINAISSSVASLPEKERPQRVLFVIITDGAENEFAPIC